MSLLDTINGAREEVAKSRSDEGKKVTNANSDDDASAGMVKRSVARAKPARSAAAGVRVAAASGTKADSARAARANTSMTSEQRKVAREEEERNRDRAATASNIMLGKDPVYRKRRTIWWVLVIVGLAMTAISFVMMYVTPPNMTNDFSTVYGAISIVVLVLAYGGIIGAIVYDFVRIRPIRRAIEDRAHALSYKRQEAIIKEDIVERRAKKSRRRGKKSEAKLA